MATTQPLTSQLRLVLFEGEDPSTGRMIVRNKNFNAVKTSATDAQLHAIAVALVSLQQRPLESIERIDRSEIQED